jgi:hypothetical protein
VGTDIEVAAARKTSRKSARGSLAAIRCATGSSREVRKTTRSTALHASPGPSEVFFRGAPTEPPPPTTPAQGGTNPRRVLHRRYPNQRPASTGGAYDSECDARND